MILSHPHTPLLPSPLLPSLVFVTHITRYVIPIKYGYYEVITNVGQSLVILDLKMNAK